MTLALISLLYGLCRKRHYFLLPYAAVTQPLNIVFWAAMILLYGLVYVLGLDDLKMALILINFPCSLNKNHSTMCQLIENCPDFFCIAGTFFTLMAFILNFWYWTLAISSNYAKRARAARRPKTEAVVGSPIRTSNLTDGQIRSALKDFVKEHAFYGKDPIDHMVIEKIELSGAYRYVLETYVETRSTRMKSRALLYEGQSIDSEEKGIAPAIWSMRVPLSWNWLTEEIEEKIPHTESLDDCSGCNGSGNVRCPRCLGYGEVECPEYSCDRGYKTKYKDERCSECFGRGYKNYTDLNKPPYQCSNCHGKGSKERSYKKKCSVCRGSGKIDCSNCDNGKVECDKCDGYGEVVWTKMLVVSRKTENDEKLLTHTMPTSWILPENKVSLGYGKVVHREEERSIDPLDEFTDAHVIAASKILHRFHDRLYCNNGSVKCHQQRQSVSLIPISRVFCSYKGKKKQFYLYGTKNKVYFPDYYKINFRCPRFTVFSHWLRNFKESHMRAVIAIALSIIFSVYTIVCVLVYANKHGYL